MGQMIHWRRRERDRNREEREKQVAEGGGRWGNRGGVLGWQMLLKTLDRSKEYPTPSFKERSTKLFIYLFACLFLEIESIQSERIRSLSYIPPRHRKIHYF